jgi:hypothetical protein
MFNGVALETQCQYCPQRNLILGLCHEHSSNVNKYLLHFSYIFNMIYFTFILDTQVGGYVMPNMHSASPKELAEVLGSETSGDGIVHEAEHMISITKGGGGCGDSKNGGQSIYVVLNICSASGRGVAKWAGM